MGEFCSPHIDKPALGGSSLSVLALEDTHYLRISLVQLLAKFRSMIPSPTQDELQQITVRKPDWGERNPNNSMESQDEIRATWLGHACFLVEFPPRQKATPEDRGIRILFDPVFSDRCSPTQYMGPKRYTRNCNVSSF